MALIDKLIHYYKLDETSGTREDSHGSLDLSVVGTVGNAAGILGNEATFGSGDNLLQSSSEVYAANGDMTISAWITPHETSRGDVIGKSGFFKIGFGITSSQWYALANFSTTSALVQSGTGFASGTRRHVLATYNAATKTVELFIDNVSVGTSTGTGTKNTPTSILFIGAERETTSGIIYNDSISDVDEVAIFDEVLTSDDRAELYNSGAAKAYPFSQQFNQAVTATASIASSLIKGMSKTLTGTATGNASVLKQMTMALSASTTITASLAKQMVVELVSTATTAATMTAIRVFLVTVEAVSTVTASIAKIPGKLLSATATITAEITKLSMLARTLQATASVTGAVLKSVSKAITATSTVTAIITKSPSKILSAVATVTSSIETLQSKILEATASVTASIVAARSVTLEATATVTATVDKVIHKTLTAVLSVVAKVIAPFWRIKYPSHGDAEDYNKKYDD